MVTVGRPLYDLMYRFGAPWEGADRVELRRLVFAFAGRREDLPRFSFGGPSRAFPGLEPGEVERRFGPAFRVEAIDVPTPTRHVGTWLLERTEARRD